MFKDVPGRFINSIGIRIMFMRIGNNKVLAVRMTAAGNR